MTSADPIRSLDEPPDAPSDRARRRLLGLSIASGLGFLALSGQLLRLQITSGSVFRAQADNNRFRLQRVEPPRGVVFDRTLTPLARNRPSYTIAIVPADLPRPPDAVLRRLARLLGTSDAEIARTLEQRTTDRFWPVPIRVAVEDRLAYTVQERSHELPGVHVLTQPIREYPDGLLASHIVGFVGRIDDDELERHKGDRARNYSVDDFIGKTGIELVREADLRGVPGQRRSEVDSGGRELRVLGVDRPRPGQNVVLSIDLGLQREVTRLLSDELPRAESASAVVLDPRDGQVLAMVHLPTYDNNAFVRGLSDDEFGSLMQDPSRPMVNGAISGAYLPGSIFKLVTAIAALETGVITETTLVDCQGAMLFPNRLAPGGATRFPCWAVHGPQDCAAALGNSCNVFFYHLGGGDPRGEADGLGIERIEEWAHRLGLGSATGLELSNEASGFVPSPTWKRRTFREDWYKGDTYNVAIGQGYVTATPMQLANLGAAIANGGKLFRPRLVLQTTDERGTVIDNTRATLIRDLNLRSDKLGVVQRGLRYTMQVGRTNTGASYTGTGWDTELRDIAMAGKTGTAEWGGTDPSGAASTHGWFVGYAPFDSPRLALAVFLKRGRGGHDAARIARGIVAYHLGVSED